MRKIIQRLAAECGYRISRLPRSGTQDNPFKEMQRLCKGIEKPIIFDVGAHQGVVSKAFRELFPSSTIYAFEPFPESFEILKANTASDSGLTVFNYGLSDQEGKCSFYANLSSATNSLLSTDEFGSKTWGKGLLETKEVVQAEFKTVDYVIRELKLPRIDILKLDVQGAEHLVMEGASNTCRKGIIHLVYSEIITQPTYKDQKRFDKALAVFYDNGFDLHDIYHMSHTHEGRLRQVDAIFTRRAK